MGRWPRARQGAGLRGSRPPVDQPACKPGSVWSCLRDGHSSGTRIAPRLVQPTRAAVPETGSRSPVARPLRLLLFGLAPGGVCRAAPVARRAVRSYRTLSPLPSGRGLPAVCFLWHFPWGRPRRPLAATLPPWSPDFPLPARVLLGHRRPTRRQRPSGRLVTAIRGGTGSTSSVPCAIGLLTRPAEREARPAAAPAS